MHTSPHSTQHTHKKNVERRTTNCRKKNKLKKNQKEKRKTRMYVQNFKYENLNWQRYIQLTKKKNTEKAIFKHSHVSFALTMHACTLVYTMAQIHVYTALGNREPEKNSHFLCIIYTLYELSKCILFVVA